MCKIRSGSNENRTHEPRLKQQIHGHVFVVGELHRISVCYGSTKGDDDPFAFSDDQSSSQVLPQPKVCQLSRSDVVMDKQCEPCVSRMTAARTGRWLTTLSAPKPPLWPPNTTSANSEWVHLRCLTCRWCCCSAEGALTCFLCLLQALYPHHGLPAGSGQVDRGEDAERVSVSG